MIKNNEQRPPLWIGHARLGAKNLDQSEEFMRLIGMRPIVKGDAFAVLELRGGTHLVLVEEKKMTPAPAPFDLMVEDLAATHQQFIDLGLQPQPIEPGKIHSSFKMPDPSGNVITFNSTHVSELPV